MIEFENERNVQARIKVVGVGGGGGNAINTMIREGLSGVDFLSANTDAQALAENLAPTKVQLGERGLGAGADPNVGRMAADASRDRLREEFSTSDMVFVTAGFGGGTGTGGAPVVAEVAKELGALTVAVVTRPFMFEGGVRNKIAEEGIQALNDVVDSLITIPNDRLLQMVGKNTSMGDAFSLADRVLLDAVQGISDLITVHGQINLDFADVRTVMNNMGMAIMGTGRATGDNRSTVAAQAAISNPLLEDVSIHGARGVLINITGGPDMTLHEVHEAATLVREQAHQDANIIFGSVVEQELDDEVRVTVIATGLSEQGRHRRREDLDSRLDNVTPIHRPRREAEIEEMVNVTSQPLQRGDDIISPFEEDYDVPAFIRRAHTETEQIG
jgi:cell division protein FtsZ